jgi:hypothetical protein
MGKKKISFFKGSYNLLKRQCKNQLISEVNWFMHTQITYWSAHAHPRQIWWLWGQLKKANNFFLSSGCLDKEQSIKAEAIREKLKLLEESVPNLVSNQKAK